MQWLIANVGLQDAIVAALTVLLRDGVPRLVALLGYSVSIRRARSGSSSKSASKPQ